MKTEFYIDETNEKAGPVVRWNSSNNIPFTDKLTEFFVQGLIDREVMLNSIALHKEEQKASIQAYIDAQQKRDYSAEEMFEMRAAFGPGEKVVNIFTGKVVQL